MSFEIGANVGPYRVMEKLGQGGMATVYKAYHANLDRYVALKVLHPAFLEDPNFLARFQREARLVAKLEHPNIVPVYDFAEHDNQPYLVMKYVEGKTLKAHLNRGRLPVEQIWNVVNAAGAGLGYAHKKGILHRDIKPSNVILTPNGEAYLADFGLARIAEMGESTLSGDMIMGTPQYISPEQAKGEKDLDNRTDIYSFAVMLYEMVVGQVPFSADTPFSIIHDHIYSPLPLPRSINPAVPDEVERVLLKALAKKPDDRFETVEDLVAAFEKAWEDTDVDMAEVTMTSPIRKKEPAPPPPSAEAETLPPEKDESAPAPVEGETKNTTVPPKPAKTKLAESTPKKKRSWWGWVAAGILLVAAFVFLLLTLGQDNLADNLQEAEIAATEAAAKPFPLPEGEGLPEFPPLPDEEHPEIAAARLNVEENPNDPYAHRDLAFAMLDIQAVNNQRAYQELAIAASLAKNDIGFFEETAFELMAREVWTGSAAMFLRALKVAKAEQLPQEQQDEYFYFLHETAYKAASQPNMPNYLPFEEIGKIDEPLMLVVEARHTFYHGDPEEALKILNELKRMKPGFFEAQLLEAEMDLRAGRHEEARRNLEALLANLETPDWIINEAETLLSELP